MPLPLRDTHISSVQVAVLATGGDLNFDDAVIARPEIDYVRVVDDLQGGEPRPKWASRMLRLARADRAASAHFW
jgi:hypothetical protein